jgi:hypothetical protein
MGLRYRSRFDTCRGDSHTLSIFTTKDMSMAELPRVLVTKGKVRLVLVTCAIEYCASAAKSGWPASLRGAGGAGRVWGFSARADRQAGRHTASRLSAAGEG